MNKLILLLLVASLPVFGQTTRDTRYPAQNIQGGDNSVFRQFKQYEHVDETPKAAIGTLIDGEGDSYAARLRIANNRMVAKAREVAEWPTPASSVIFNGQPIANTATRHKMWYSDIFFDQHEDYSRTRLDAWTYQRGFVHNSIVVSCVYDNTTSTGSKLKFFLRTATPIHKFGAAVDVEFIVGYGNDEYTLSGHVSKISSTNIHIDVDPNTVQHMIGRMRAASLFRVRVQPVGTADDLDIPFSLNGFTAATANTISNCMENVQ